MGGLDAPRLRIEVVGAIADVLDGSEWNAFVGDGDDPTRRIGGKHKGLASEVFQSLGEIDINAGIALLEFGLQHFSCHTFAVKGLWLERTSFTQGTYKEALATGDARDETINGLVKAL